MPSQNSLWIVTAPVDSSPDEQLEDLEVVIGNAKAGVNASSLLGRGGKLGEAVPFEFPEFKTGTLSSLLTLSESLAKHDPTTTAALSKTVDTIRSLIAPSTVAGIADRSSPLSSHLVIDDGRPYLDYLFPQGPGEKKWEWNRSKYRTESKSLAEVIEVLVKEVGSIENAQRNKTAQYMLVKGQLSAAARKKMGNLSIRSLADVVSAEDFAGTNESEYLETVLVAVPKNSVKEWETSYERLSQMVVPRSSTKLASDEDFVLFSVAIFRRVRDEFAQKCRENKFIVRDFTYDEEAMEKQRVELAALEVQEKELWTDLLRLSRINFSEIFQVLVHLKIVRAYIESVLRYGLPANYFGTILKPEPKQATKLASALTEHFKIVSPVSRRTKAAKGTDEEAPVGEYATVLEGEYLDFVLFEVERIDGA